NLSYNELTELPQGLIKRWQFLIELYLSGNQLSALPSDDLEESSNLRVLHINANTFQVLPAELCKVNRLAILDVGSNCLKYKIAKFLHENFTHTFIEELRRLREAKGETPLDALRRSFLALNKDMAAAASKSIDDRVQRHYGSNSPAAKLLNQDDIRSGAVATIL